MWIVAGIVGLAIIAGGGWIFLQWSVETPGYHVVRSEGDFEVRDYPALLAAEVAKSGARREAVSAGFSPLAGYIFAKKRDGEKIAMTAPVTQTQDVDVWKVRFLMPAQYTRETLPAPAADVDIVEVPPQRMAVVRFSGGMDDPLYIEKEQALRDWMGRQGLTATGPVTFAYYNDPFTPNFLRRNEVMIPIGDAR